MGRLAVCARITASALPDSKKRAAGGGGDRADSGVTN
jgi:hypothetical protein